MQMCRQQAYVNRLRLLHLLLAFLLQSCSESCKEMSFESWRAVDRVVVELSAGGVDRTISDPVVIQKIRMFIESRKDQWEVPFPDTSSGRLSLEGYQGEQGISHLSIGRNFIEAPLLDILGIADSVFQ